MAVLSLDQALREVVALACRAPSIGNSQPWRWVLAGDRVDLIADGSRRLGPSDPVGRQLVISCGSALHHAQIAAAGAQFTARIDRFPDPERPDLLASLRFASGEPPPEAEARLLLALKARHTDRRRFTAWPMDPDRLSRLAASVEDAQVRVVVVADTESRRSVDELIRQSTGDRTTVLPSDGLLALCSDRDEPAAWLRVGEALSQMWLDAVEQGLALVPLSEVVESTRTRSRLVEHFIAPVTPHLLVRVGWQELGGRESLQTPRRPLDEVLDRR